MGNDTEIAALVMRFVNQTNKSVFLTGKAGTGKTTLLHAIIASTHKKTVVVAPTGIAALNAGGVTIHSLFQLPFATFLPTNHASAFLPETVRFESRDTLKVHFVMNRIKRNIIRNLELLIIDEVSMLRADVLDAMDFMLQYIRRNTLPFGGVQVLFIGDLLQLPPVVKEDEWQVLQQYYKGMFFFNAHVLQQNPPAYIELEKIYRQTDALFIDILNNLRNNFVSDDDMQVLERYVDPYFDIRENQGYIILTTHNKRADSINQQAMSVLESQVYTYNAKIVDDFPERIYPIDFQLSLKVGAQVMFVKNDLSPERRYFNGKMAVVVELSEEEIVVRTLDEHTLITVDTYEWNNIRYQVDGDTKEIVEVPLGTFTQYPLRLAWAITVHKSQGLTFDKAVLDVSNVFAPGQAYVALSRLRSLKGLVMLAPLQLRGIQNDATVMSYADNKKDTHELTQLYDTESRQYIHHTILKTFTWDVLVKYWVIHLNTYDKGTDKSKKMLYYDWAVDQLNEVQTFVAYSEKFKQQLHHLFNVVPYNFDFIVERVEKAIGYFFPLLDKVTYTILETMEKVKQTKKMKLYFQELTDLEEVHVNAVLHLFKLKKYLKCITENAIVDKSVFETEEILGYKTKHVTTIKKELSTLKLTDTDSDKSYYETEPVKEKVSTVDQTLQLWREKHSVEDIALVRKLTTQTIYSHLSKLIARNDINIEDVLKKETLSELQFVFEGKRFTSLGQAKEIAGEAFTWEDIKLFVAWRQQND